MQEYLALGMSKGSIYILHVNMLNRLYCRFTVHREAVQKIQYMPHTDSFVSISSENDLYIWRIDKQERNIKILN